MRAQRGKKRQWKAACATADAEIASLHAQLLARGEEIQGLEKRIENLETEVGSCRLLGLVWGGQGLGPAAGC